MLSDEFIERLSIGDVRVSVMEDAGPFRISDERVFQFEHDCYPFMAVSSEFAIETRLINLHFSNISAKRIFDTYGITIPNRCTTMKNLHRRWLANQVINVPENLDLTTATQEQLKTFYAEQFEFLYKSYCTGLHTVCQQLIKDMENK